MAQENKMYFSHPANKSYKQTGLALIELLVGIVVSLIALAFLLNIYLTNIRSTSETVNAARLDDDLRSAMTYMVEEIRRAGYWKNSVSNQEEPQRLPIQNATRSVPITMNWILLTATPQ